MVQLQEAALIEEQERLAKEKKEEDMISTTHLAEDKKK